MVEGWVNQDTAVSVQPVPEAAYRSDFREIQTSVRRLIRIWTLSLSRQACYNYTTATTALADDRSSNDDRVHTANV